MMQLQWKMGEAGSIQINDSEYFLQQCHWHSPSEHTINGRRSLSLSLFSTFYIKAPELILIFRLGIGSN